MEKLTITQTYFLLVVGDGAKKSLSSSLKSGIGIIIANTLDLIFKQSICLNQQGRLVSNTVELASDQPYLSSVHKVVIEKSPIKTSRLVSRYAQSIKNQLTEVFQLTGDSLTAYGMVSEEKREKFFKNSVYYEVNSKFLKQQVEQLKESVTQQWSIEDASLMMLFKETKLLKKYLTKEEVFEVKEKLNSYKQLPEVKLVKTMISDFVNQLDSPVVFT